MAPQRRKTAFDRYVATRRKKSRDFAGEYKRAKAESNQTDAIMRELDQERARVKMTKAESR
jgi:hypothetical protein